MWNWEVKGTKLTWEDDPLPDVELGHEIVLDDAVDAITGGAPDTGGVGLHLFVALLNEKQEKLPSEWKI